DRRPLGSAVQAIARITALVEEIESPGAESIVRTGRHAAAPFGKFRLASDHGRRRRPDRPGPLHRDAGRTLPLEALASDADAVAHGLALGHDEVEMLGLRVDDDRAGFLVCLVIHHLAAV